MKNDAEKAEHVNLPVMRLRGLLFVPHYVEKDIMVAPGGIMMQCKDLTRAGTALDTLPLWSRVWLRGVA